MSTAPTRLSACNSSALQIECPVLKVTRADGTGLRRLECELPPMDGGYKDLKLEWNGFHPSRVTLPELVEIQGTPVIESVSCDGSCGSGAIVIITVSWITNRLAVFWPVVHGPDTSRPSFYMTVKLWLLFSLRFLLQQDSRTGYRDSSDPTSCVMQGSGFTPESTVSINWATCSSPILADDAISCVWPDVIDPSMPVLVGVESWGFIGTTWALVVPPVVHEIACPLSGCSTAGGDTLTLHGSRFLADSSLVSVHIGVSSS